jgi:hypothetical protein
MSTVRGRILGRVADAYTKLSESVPVADMATIMLERAKSMQALPAMARDRLMALSGYMPGVMSAALTGSTAGASTPRAGTEMAAALPTRTGTGVRQHSTTASTFKFT